MVKGSADDKIFGTVINHMQETGLVKKDELQIIDATNVNASVSFVGPIEMFRRSMVNVIRVLRKEGVITTDEVKNIGLGRYIAHLDQKARATALRESKMPEERKLAKLAEIYLECKALLSLIADRDLKGGHTEVEILKRILNENVVESGDTIQTKKSKDCIISVTDPEARSGAKNKKLKFDGYKANLLTTKSGVITAVSITPGNMVDGVALPELVEKALQVGLKPEKLIADSAYSMGENVLFAREKGIKLSARGLGNELPKGFVYNKEDDTITCPNGLKSNKGRKTKRKSEQPDKREDRVAYSFHKPSCKECPHLKECRGDKRQKRFYITIHHQINSEMREYNKTQEYKDDMKIRPFVERSISWIINRCKARRSRLRGIRNVQYLYTMAAAMINLMMCLRLRPAQS